MSRRAQGQGATRRGTEEGSRGRRPPRTRAEILTRLSEAMQRRGYSGRTEETYLGWSRRFFRFVGPRARVLRPDDVNRFLTHLAGPQGLSPRTVNQAASALTFLYGEAFGIRLGDGGAPITRAKQGHRRPTVLTRTEVRLLLDELHGIPRLAASLLYGSGLRVGECMALRMKDLCLDSRTVTVRDGKGRKDRTTVLAREVVPALREQMGVVRTTHEDDRRGGAGWAPLPGALHRKLPGDGWLLAWQHLFPSPHLTVDRPTGHRGRAHLHPTVVQRAVGRAWARTGIPKRASCHTLRHSFATHALRAGIDPRTVQRLMGHKSLRTTMIYLHPEMPGEQIVSPLDLHSDY